MTFTLTQPAMDANQILPAPEIPPLISPGIKAYIGIDNGFTGALACLLPSDEVLFRPVSVLDLGKEKLLDIPGNLAVLKEMVALAESAGVSLMAVYEQCQPNPLFGSKNNFTNGKNGEFWRLLLSSQKIPFQWVNPQQWQKQLFRGIRGSDTKAMAELVRNQRLPHLTSPGFSRTKLEGINDAICLALWARDNLK